MNRVFGLFENRHLYHFFQGFLFSLGIVAAIVFGTVVSSLGLDEQFKILMALAIVLGILIAFLADRYPHSLFGRVVNYGLRLLIFASPVGLVAVMSFFLLDLIYNRNPGDILAFLVFYWAYYHSLTILVGHRVGFSAALWVGFVVPWSFVSAFWLYLIFPAALFCAGRFDLVALGLPLAIAGFLLLRPRRWILKTVVDRAY